MPNAARYADELLTALSNRHQLSPLTGRGEPIDEAYAYRISRAVTARRVAQGERVVGRKIGFTNRTIWEEYGVHRPIYGPMYDTTVQQVDGPAQTEAARYVEPRIEPEIVLGLIAAPEPDMDEMELMSCIGWVAHGFEVVQSLFPGWKFALPDCVAAFGLHGGLFIGPRATIVPDDHGLWLDRLTSFSLHLSCNGVEVDVGKAANVLDGPVSALRHLAEAISLDREADPIRSGEIITTGTVTRAFPVEQGQRWTTRLVGIDLPGMDLAFV